MTDSITKVRVFVTTQGAIAAHGYGYGKFFDLENYADHESFMAAAHEYARWRIEDPDPKLCFRDAETTFDLLFIFGEYQLISEAAISPLVWELIALSKEDVALLDAYLSVCQSVTDNFTDTLVEAKEQYIGHFSSNAVYAEHVYKDELSMLASPLLKHIDMHAVGNEIAADLMIRKGHYFKPKN